MLYGVPVIVMGNALKMTTPFDLVGEIMMAIGIIISVCLAAPLVIIRYIFTDWIVDE
jgi:hypothetical protein